MINELLDPPPQLSPAKALLLSQQAPILLKSSATGSAPYPLSLFISKEAPETWIAHENLLYACLRTGDDRSARLCLERMTERFGEGNERVMALKGAYEEAVANDPKALEKVLDGYEKTLKSDPSNMPIRKRRIALLKSLSRPTEAIAALVDLIDVSPIDAEAWAELADQYFAQGLYQQAVYSLEEVLLITPNAWNIHTRLGEVLYTLAMAGSSGNENNPAKLLAESMRRFCRSIELCDNYLRGYYGLKFICKHLLDTSPKPAKNSAESLPGDLSFPSPQTIQRLHELATEKLAEIIRRSTSREAGWTGFSEAELIAARELLDRDDEKVAR